MQSCPFKWHESGSSFQCTILTYNTFQFVIDIATTLSAYNFVESFISLQLSSLLCIPVSFTVHSLLLNGSAR